MLKQSSRSLPTRTTFLRRRIVAGVLVVLVGWLAFSLGSALTAPGTDSTAARLAEWARFHGMGWAVSWAEQAQYAANQPTEGGSVHGGIPNVAGSASGGVTSRLGQRDAPAPIAPVAAGSLPGEGQWQTLERVGGQVAMRAAFLRPDAVHTSYLVGVVWMDPSRLRFVLHPGYRVPGGGPWTQADQIPAAQRGSVIATFNSGFTMIDAEGGWYQGGHTLAPLQKGAASMVIGTDGRVDVRTWTGGPPPAGVDSVRQNLVLLVDHGRLNPLVDSPVTKVWGKTIGNKAFVWRTAIGVRRDGTVVFVVGPALTVRTLAVLAQRAGCIRAMELDINPDWTNFLTYTHPSAGSAVPHQLTYDRRINPDRYLQPSSRDFVAVLPR